MARADAWRRDRPCTLCDARLPCGPRRAPGRGHVHRLRPVHHPRPDHGDRDGPRASAWVRSIRGSGLEPSAATSHAQGFWVGFLGMLGRRGADAGGPRGSDPAALRREAMGFGDVTLMGMIGAFLGWQAAVMTFFPGPSSGLAHAFWKLGALRQEMARRPEIIERRSRTPFRTLPEHGGHDPGLLVALALGRLGPRVLRDPATGCSGGRSGSTSV